MRNISRHALDTYRVVLVLVWIYDRLVFHRFAPCGLDAASLVEWFRLGGTAEECAEPDQLLA